MLVIVFKVAATVILLAMGATVLGGLIVLWRFMPLMAAAIALLLIGTMFWMRDRVKHEREVGSDTWRDGPPPRGPAEARRRDLF